MAPAERRGGGSSRSGAGGGPCTRTPLSAAQFGVVALLALFAFALSQPNAAANMRPLFEFELSIGVFFIVFLMNLPFNLFAYSALVLVVCTVWGRSAGQLPKGEMDFVSRVLLAVLLITTLGVAIDFVFLYRNETEYVFELDPLKWLAASAAVGLSVYALSLTVLRMDMVLGVAPALAMMGLNLASWWFIVAIFESSATFCLAAPSMLVGFLSIIPLVYLDKWHRKAFVHELADVA